jgi:predicted NBD/HSP70 family sugar kinase
MQRSGPVEGTPAEAAVLTTVLAAGAIARADIARRTGLSSAAVTRAAQPLLDAGFLRYADDSSRNGDDEAARMGRPSRPLAVDAGHTGTVGVKLTEHEALGVVVDLSGSVRARGVRTLADTSVPTALTAVEELVTELRAAADGLGFAQPVRHVGLSISGDVDHTTGHVRYSPFLGWRDVQLGALTAARTRCPVVVENDVKALTVAEQWFGLARGLDDFALITIGAGIGCALVVDGALVRGSHSVAGEIGHLPVGDPTVRCHCGGRGCVEAEASAAALLHRCREVAGEPGLTLDDAVQRARSGDRAVAAVFARAGRLIGLAIASVANLLGPAQVIVSGEGLASYDLLGDAIRETFAEQAFGAAERTALHLQPLPLEEWARGAAAVALEELAFPSRVPGNRRALGTGDV